MNLDIEVFVQMPVLLPYNIQVPQIVLYGLGAVSTVLAAAYVFHGISPSNQKRKIKVGFPIGITNTGNLCFVSCTLHGIASCEKFWSWLKSSETKYFSLAISSLVQDLNSINGVNTPIENALPTSSLRSLFQRHKLFVTVDQEDAHEFLYLFLNSIEEEMDCVASSNSITDCLDKISKLDDITNYSWGKTVNSEKLEEFTSNLSYYVNQSPPFVQPCPFRGLLVCEVKCAHCFKKKSLNYDSFLTMSVSLTNICNTVSLFFLLNDITKPEFISNLDCEMCSKNGSQSMFIKQTSIAQFPQCLCIHIQRTYWDNNHGLYKRNIHVFCPEILVMDSYAHLTPMKKHVKHKNESLGLSVIKDPTGGAKHIYKLKAAVVHYGSGSCGHFVTYRKGYGGYCNQWFYVSDSTVRKCSFEELRDSQIYLLFYQKINT